MDPRSQPGMPEVPALDARGGSAARWVVAGVLLVALVLGAGGALLLHNSVVDRREAVDAAWGQVESSYQRRADLVPALVEAVRRHMRHERETFRTVVEARGEGAGRGLAERAEALLEAQRASSAALAEAGRGGGAEALARLSAADRRVSRGLRGVLALAEAYPRLRSADHFLELQAQLEGTENRIHVARMRFNEAVREHNAALEKIPTRTFARARGYERRAYFESDEGAERAPALELD